MNMEIQTTKLTRIGLWLVAIGFFAVNCNLVKKVVQSYGHIWPSGIDFLRFIAWVSMFLGFVFTVTIRPRWLCACFFAIMVALFWLHSATEIFLALLVVASIFLGVICYFLGNKMMKVFGLISGFLWVIYIIAVLVFDYVGDAPEIGFRILIHMHDFYYSIALFSTAVLFIIIATTATKYKKIKSEEAKA